jgi:ABC-type molybdate transport system substrate-binding protein
MKKVILIATLFFSVCMFANAQKSVKVAAAANLRDVFMEIKEAYEKENPGVKIDVTDKCADFSR